MHKILLAVENESPSLSWESVFPFEKEIARAIKARILYERKAQNAPCHNCHTPCEILEKFRKLCIFCNECGSTRFQFIEKNETKEWRIDVEALLLRLLGDLGIGGRASISEKTWSLGSHFLAGESRMFFFARNADAFDTSKAIDLAQQSSERAVIFLPFAPARKIDGDVLCIALDKILSKNKNAIFDKTLFRKFFGHTGRPSEKDGIPLGKNGFASLEKRAILWDGDAVGIYRQKEEITETAHNILAFLHHEGKGSRNVWHTRKDLAQRMGVEQKTVSNERSIICAIAEKIGLEIIQTRKNGKINEYRISPDALP